MEFELPKSFSMVKLESTKPLTDQGSQAFRSLIHVLVMCLQDLQAGTMSMSDVVGINRQPSFSEFQNFLESMEIYGCGYKDDVDIFKYNQRNTETHS